MSYDIYKENRSIYVAEKKTKNHILRYELVQKESGWDIEVWIYDLELDQINKKNVFLPNAILEKIIVPNSAIKILSES